MSRFEFVRMNEEFEIWKYTPDIIHAFPFHMEPIRIPWRIRCVMEFFIGYNVFYIKKENQWAGYCVISSGKNPRYSFSTDKDIIYGRYYIANRFRGNHLAARMLREILVNCGLTYEKAFAYLRINNIASVNTMRQIGAREIKRFDIRGCFRNLYDNKDGDYVLYEYNREST